MFISTLDVDFSPVLQKGTLSKQTIVIARNITDSLFRFIDRHEVDCFLMHVKEIRHIPNNLTNVHDRKTIEAPPFLMFTV